MNAAAPSWTPFDPIASSTLANANMAGGAWKKAKKKKAPCSPKKKASSAAVRRVRRSKDGRDYIVNKGKRMYL